MDFVRITACGFLAPFAPRWARGQQPAPGRPEIESGDLGGWASPASNHRAHHHLCLQGSHFRAGRGFLWPRCRFAGGGKAPPAGTLRYQSDRTYGIDDGLQVLNTILQAKGVMLRRREDMLYLQPLAEMAKRDVPTFVGSLPDTVTDDEVVTLVLPLRIASANALVEQLRGLVAGYGSVSALPQQNALVIVETAAQVRRLAGMVASFDAQDTDGIVRIIKLEHVGAEAIMGPLRSLLAVRVEKYVVDAKGKQVKVEDEQIPGITFSPDARTNSLIVKGNEPQISKLEEAVRLLDVPTDRSSGRRTFTWKTADPKTSSGRLGFVRQPTAQGQASEVASHRRDKSFVCHGE